MILLTFNLREAMRPIRFRATFDEYLWDSDEPDSEPTETNGYTDPRNPWGGFDVEPDYENAPPYPHTAKDWDTYLAAEGVETITFDNLWDAAEFAQDFPGGIWDLSESESEQNFRTGAYRRVTLHVLDGAEGALFPIIELVERIRYRRPVAV